MLTAAILGAFFGVLGFGFGLAAFIKVLATEKATHTVHMKPLEPYSPTQKLAELQAEGYATEIPTNDQGYDVPTDQLEQYLMGRE